MSWHPTDEDLILHFYGEAPDDEGRIDGHLGVCAACQEAWTDLRETLKLVDVAPVPEPPAGFERVMWARVQPMLPARHTPRPWWSVRQLVPLVGFAAVALITASVAYVWRAAPPNRPDAPVTIDRPGTAPAAAAGQTRERVLLQAAGQHFEQAEMLLVELMNTSEKSQSLSFERETAGDLVASSRLYRQTAEQNGDGRLAEMLEDLESVLVEVSHAPDKMDRSDLASLRARIDGSRLLFKVRAVSNEIRERQRTLSTVSEGTL